MQPPPRRTAFGTSVLVMATLGMAIVLLPLWQAIFWAVVLAILFWPLRQKAVRWFGGRTAPASGLIVLLILVFVMIPALIIAGLIVDGAVAVVKQVQSGAFQPEKILEALPTRFPKAAAALTDAGIDIQRIKTTVGQGFVSVA